MRQVSMGLATIALLIQPAVAAQPQAGREVTLYCTGETYVPIGNSEKAEAEAFVRITNKETYIEIDAVGNGTFSGRPKLITNMQANGTFLLRPVIVGQEPVEVQYNINRFTGQLYVFPKASQGKVFFVGKCREATPLF